MTSPSPVEPRRPTDAQTAHERLVMDYPVVLERRPNKTTPRDA